LQYCVQQLENNKDKKQTVCYQSDSMYRHVVRSQKSWAMFLSHRCDSVS